MHKVSKLGVLFKDYNWPLLKLSHLFFLEQLFLRCLVQRYSEKDMPLIRYGSLRLGATGDRHRATWSGSELHMVQTD